MAIDRVPAGVADAADEPAAVDIGGRAEHSLRRLDPIDRARSLRPKALRVALPVCVDLMVASLHRSLPRSTRPPLWAASRPLQTGAERRIRHLPMILRHVPPQPILQ